MEGVAASLTIIRNCVAVCHDDALRMVAQRTLANRVEHSKSVEAKKVRGRKKAEDSLCTNS